MKFEQQEQWRLYKQVEACLEREFGDVAEASDTDPAFMLHLGAVLLMVTVDPVGPDHASVLMYARPGEHVDVTPEIAHFLLRTSHDLAFGKLGLNPKTMRSPSPTWSWEKACSTTL